MDKPKAKYKKGQAFFLPKESLFVQIDGMNYYEGKDKGWLYDLKCYKHEQDEKKPFKRYYEHRITNELQPLKTDKAIKVLYAK